MQWQDKAQRIRERKQPNSTDATDSSETQDDGCSPVTKQGLFFMLLLFSNSSSLSDMQQTAYLTRANFTETMISLLIPLEL